MAPGRRVGQRPDCHTFLCKFFAVSQWKLVWLTPNLEILWISVSSFWLCESIVANPIIYRLVPRPSRFETRQLCRRLQTWSPGQTYLQVVVSGHKLNLRKDFRSLPNGLASFFAGTPKSRKKKLLTQTILDWKVYFSSPSGEMYAGNLVKNCAQSGENFLGAVFLFLEAVGAKWGSQQRQRPLESKLKWLSGKNKLVKENASASNEPMNFRNWTMIFAISEIGHVSLSRLII